MRSLGAALAPLLLLAASAADALMYRDQVDQVDFHHALLGLPQRATTFFHRPRRDDRASLLYTLSDAGVLGAVNPSTGVIVWRHALFDDENDTDGVDDAGKAGGRDDSPGCLVPVEGEGWLAAARGPAVHAWTAVSGRNVWWAEFAGEVVDVAVVEATAETAAATTAAPARKDVLALSRETAADGSRVAVLRRIGGGDGRVVWEHRESSSGGGPADEPSALRIATTADKAYVVSATAGAPLHVFAVDLATGQHRTDAHSLGGGDVRDADAVLFAGGGGVVAWTDGSARAKLRVQVLGSRHKHEFALPEGATVHVHALGQPSSSPSAPSAPSALHLLVHTRTADNAAHEAQIYHADLHKGTVTKAYDLPAAPGAGAFAVTDDGRDDGPGVFFTRITDDDVVLVHSAAPDELGRWPLAQPTPVHALGAAAAEIVVKAANAADASYAVRAAVLTGSEDWVLVRPGGRRAWTRPEGMTGAVAAVLADRPASEQLLHELEAEEAQAPLAAYIHRVRRHIADLERLPAYLQALPERLLRSIVGGAAAGDDAGANAGDDAFGFHKIAVLATRRGRLYGLDAASPGAVLWTTQAMAVPTWDVKHMHVDAARGVVIVVGPTPAQSLAVHIATGEIAAVGNAIDGLVGLDGLDATRPIASAVLVSSAAGPYLLAVPADGRVSTTLPVEQCPHEALVVRASGTSIEGVRFAVAGGACVPETTWTFAAPRGFRIVDVATRPAHDPVASMGRVLGDRRVLYKYLNPHMAVVAALDDATAELLTVLLDTASGQVLATATYAGVDGAKPVECLVLENSFLCTFFGDYVSDAAATTTPPPAIKGYHVALSDLYMSTTPNERGALGDGRLGNASAVGPVEGVVAGSGDVTTATALGCPAVVAQTWVAASRLRALAATQTLQGITVREVLAFAPRLQGIVGLLRVGGVLDARRPVGRDPTPAETEEGLARYTPALEVDPRQVVTHERPVLGVRRLVTAPTHVESTSLVLALGAVDVFGTRVAPSLVFDLLDKGFGKAQMLATVAALAAGVAVLRPLVARKQINLRWRAPQ